MLILVCFVLVFLGRYHLCFTLPSGSTFCHGFRPSMRCNDRDLDVDVDVDAFFIGCGRVREQLRDQQHPEPRRPQSPHRERRKVRRGQVLILSDSLVSSIGRCGRSAGWVWL